MNPTNDPNGLPPYVSSAPELVQEDKPLPQDQEDTPTLQKVLLLLENRERYYNSRESLVYGQDITVENQLIINTQMVRRIQELKGMINTTINKVKENQDGRQF